jgi:BirA family transcriptional regulator, biotin operon repressor / biotin---[acetyl-CoA-carboxylase] ligase
MARGATAKPVRGPRPDRNEPAPLAAQVFGRLSDGRFHSGEQLAKTLGVSRSAVWKAVRALRELGATLHAVRNRGYRLAHAGEPLDPASIRGRLARDVRDRVVSVEAAWTIPSTNTVLLARPNPGNGTSEVLLAEYQSAGRGRRGRTWLAPPGGAICLSLNWTFGEVPQELSALGLVIGVCVLRALGELGLEGAGLKWPNDVLVDERKLGGVLIELRAESAGPACVVVGVGLNVALGAALIKQLAEAGTAATDLASAGLAAPSRNEVAAAVIGACVRGLLEFEGKGLKPFIEEWRAADALRGRPVNVSGADGTARGLARGIDLHGALLLETPQGLRRFISGDVSVRA